MTRTLRYSEIASIYKRGNFFVLPNHAVKNKKYQHSSSQVLSLHSVCLDSNSVVAASFLYEAWTLQTNNSYSSGWIAKSGGDTLSGALHEISMAYMFI